MESAELPHDGEGDVVCGRVRVPFAPGERHSVIGGDDDEGVIEEAATFEGIQHLAEVSVEVFSLECVVEDVVTNDVVVGPERGNARKVFKFFATFGDSGAVFVPSVRFEAAVPEAPGFVFRGCVEESIEVGGVIDGGDAIGWGFGFGFVPGFAGHVPRGAAVVEGDAGPPALCGESDVPTFGDEGFRPCLELRWEEADVIGCGFELPGVPAGQDAGSRGGAFGVRRESIAEEDP